MKPTLSSLSFILATVFCPSVSADPLQSTDARSIAEPTQGLALARDRKLESEAAMSLPVFDQPGDGTLWVRGEDFKARFDRHGLQFIPFLGSDAPQDYPVDFSILSARVGERELAWVADVDPEREGSRVIYHRGAFEEIFDVRCGSIEHSFVLEHPVRGGDLNIQVRVEGTLERTSNELGMAFFNERGGVRYGHATLIDAGGQRLASATRLVGDSIEIRAPAADIELAAYPLTVDPIISTFQVNDATMTTQQVSPDVAFDLTSNTFLCVYESVFSSTDHDVVARQMDGSGNPVNGGTTFIDFTSSSWTGPRVANNNAQDQFMVVAKRVDNLGPAIVARTRSALSTAMGGQFLVRALPSVWIEAPDVGGDAYPNGAPAYCVVWCETDVWNNFSRVRYQMISPFGTFLVTGDLALVSAGMCTGSSISKSNGNPSYGNCCWTAVWGKANGQGVTVQCAQVSPWGSIVTPDNRVAVALNLSGRPAVSSLFDSYLSSRPFMVAFVDNGVLRGTIRMNGSTNTSSVLDFRGLAQHDPRVEYDGLRAVVAYHEDVNVLNRDVFISTFALTGGAVPVLIESHAQLGMSPNAPEIGAALCAKHTSGSWLRDCMTVWQRPTVQFGHGFIPGGIFGFLSYSL